MTMTVLLDEWQEEVAGDSVLRPSLVQNHLLELHDVVEGPARAAVERWLTSSVGRSGYSAAEVEQMITELRLEMELGSAAQPSGLDPETTTPA